MSGNQLLVCSGRIRTASCDKWQRPHSFWDTIEGALLVQLNCIRLLWSHNSLVCINFKPIFHPIFYSFRYNIARRRWFCLSHCFICLWIYSLAVIAILNNIASGKKCIRHWKFVWIHDVNWHQQRLLKTYWRGRHKPELHIHCIIQNKKCLLEKLNTHEYSLGTFTIEKKNIVGWFIEKMGVFNENI